EIFQFLAKYFPFTATNPGVWRENLSEWGCPYQLIKQLCTFVDIVLTTHGYLIQPHLRKQLFRLTQADQAPETKILLLDEVHGLASPAIIAELPLESLYTAAQLYPTKELVILAKKSRYPGLVRPLKNLHPEGVESFLNKSRKWEKLEYQSVVALYEFLRVQGDYWIFTEDQLMQVNPYPETIFQAFEGFHKVIGMSGTIKPLDQHVELFGASRYFALEVPRALKNHFLAIATELRFSTEHENRTSKMIHDYAQAIQQLHALNPKHTFVAYPSHDLKDQFTLHFDTKYVEDQECVPTWLPELQHRDHELIFAVMGGRLTEGVEILDPQTKQSKITLVIVVGLPFPINNALTQVLMYLYTQRYSPEQAEQYLVYLPVLTKVLQTIGRGIRSPRDYSAAIILDHRAIQFPLGTHQKLYCQFDILLKDLFSFYHCKRSD
ncbi:MAG: helicase C-terminal domain-containing protein, partial [Candidatus Hodarchaeota archaeon]